MSPPPHDPCSAALGHWKSVQKRLASTIQDYLKACATLKMSLMAHPSDILSYRLQAKAFADLDSHLPTLYVYEADLQAARISLHVTRNNSQSLVPINSLPPEILNIIVSLTNREWVNQDYVTVRQGSPVSASTLASVCSRWRGLMLQSPSLWSRLELVLSGPSSESHYQRAALWAERSQNATLHISVREGDPKSPPQAVGELRIDKAIRFLTPLMPRVCAFEIACSWFTDFVYPVVNCWVRCGSIGTAELLKIQAFGGFPVTLPAGYTDMGYEVIPFDIFEPFFRSLHTLSLENTLVHRSRAIYSGLVDLHLGRVSPQLEPSHSELAAILAESPGLRSLVIVGLRIKVEQGRMPPPVALNNLEVLSLESEHPEALWFLLQIITSTSEAIRMSLSLENHPGFVPAARSFFRRCKVTILHIDSRHPWPHLSVSSLFVHMPYLEQLAIHNCPLPDATWEDLIFRRSVSGIWPRLRELYLTDCNPDKIFLQQLVSIGVPRVLWVYDDHLSSMHACGDAKVLGQTRKRLLKSGVELVLVDSWDMMPTRRWGFVHSHEFA